MTPIEIIDAAKKLLIEEGWVQGTYRNHKGYCAVGALRFASGLAQFKSDQYYDQYMDARNCVDRIAQDKKYANIIDFNDTKGTVLADVLSIFDEAKACVVS